MLAKSLATFIYGQILYSRTRLGFRIFSKLRALFLRFSDPIITLEFRGFTLSMPFSHTLFINQKLYPNYDMQLHKIASYIQSKTDQLRMIDIGANIGDTAVLTNIAHADFLLVEGEKSYFDLLKKNVFRHYAKTLKEQQGGGIKIENCFITDKDGTYNINLAQGSGRLEKITPADSLESKHHADSSNPANHSDSLIFKTLDSIVSEHNFKPNFIKIDTDGFDFKVLRSAQQTLKESQSLVLFEWDMFHLQAQDENPLSIFSYLESLGYHQALIFDNFGTLLCAVELSDTQNLKLLLDYTLYSNKNIYYYDVLLFPKNSPFEIYECAQFITAISDS